MATEPADSTESEKEIAASTEGTGSESEQREGESSGDTGAEDPSHGETSPPPVATKSPKAAPKNAAKVGSKVGARGAGARGKRPAPRKSGISMRNVLVFGALVVLLLAGFGVLGTRDAGGPNNAPRWKLNEPVDVELTLVASDASDLNCAMEGEVAGLHCGFTAANAKNPAAQGSRDDAKLLQPYSTTTRQNFLASGVWMQPDTKDAAALDAKIKSMQNPRFSLSCKFIPRGRAKTAKVQWKPGSDWNTGDGWYIGEVKDCKLPK
jgi:hypothetical protein